jgi:hypothetical protein
MADGFKRKRGDSAQPFITDFVREPDDDPIDGTGLVAGNIIIRIKNVETGVEVISEAVDSIVNNPLQATWKADAAELDVEAGDYAVSYKITWATGDERFPLEGWIPLVITQNYENLPT